MPTAHDLDAHLERLRRAAARVSSNLVELEATPVRVLLDAGALDGATASRWLDARESLGQLFAWYGELTAVLDAATAVRGQRPSVSAAKAGELTRLLCGPSIVLSEHSIAPVDRELLSGSQAVVRVSPDELLGRMADEYHEVKEVVAGVARAWDEVLPRVRVAGARAKALTELVAGDHVEVQQQLARRVVELEDLQHRLATDPLSVGSTPLDAIERELTVLQGRLTAAAELRRRWPDARADADARLAELDRLIATTTAQHAELATKLVCDKPVPVTLDELAARLTEIDHAARQGRWDLVATQLQRWERDVERSTERTLQDAAADRALLGRRRELRGLLGAYVAKARALGRQEDGSVGPLLADAQLELYRDPTDLDRAAELLGRCQEALSGVGQARAIPCGPRP